MIPVRAIPRILCSVAIGVFIFMGIMPDSIKGMPPWWFYTQFFGSLFAGWLITGLIAALFRYGYKPDARPNKR